MVDNESIKIGALITRLRRSKQLSQEELAFRCGIGRKQMSNIERDEHLPHFITFIKIAKNLDMLPSELFKIIEETGLLTDIYKEDEY